MNTKQKGNLALAEAIRFFTIRGNVVSIPLNDSQKYDLIVDMEGILYKVECKYTSTKKASGNFAVHLRTLGGTKGTEVSNRASSENADYLFVTTSDNNSYLINLFDIEHINSELTITDDIKVKYGCAALMAEGLGTVNPAH